MTDISSDSSCGRSRGQAPKKGMKCGFCLFALCSVPQIRASRLTVGGALLRAGAMAGVQFGLGGAMSLFSGVIPEMGQSITSGGDFRYLR